MPIRETPPEEGRGRNRTANWSNLKTARGERHECYACGRTQWYDCHTNFGVTQPCLKLVTGGALACPRCTEGVETMGYVALWLAGNLKPHFALVHHDQRERTDGLVRGQPVYVGRDDHKTAGIYVLSRSGNKASFLRIDKPSLLAPVDLLPTLLKVWKLPQLAAWVAQQQKLSDNALSLDKPTPLTSQGEEFGEMTKAAAQKYTTDTPADANEVFVASVNRVKRREGAYGAKPSANGHPKSGE